MLRQSVLIISPKDDLHSLAVEAIIARNYPNFSCLIFDANQFPTEATIHITQSGWKLQWNEHIVSSSDLCSIWWRRRRPHKIDHGVRDASVKQFTTAECIHAFDFLAQDKNYIVVNPLERDFAANRKPHQLAMARACELLVPDYLITNDPSVFWSLVSSGEEYIYKTLTAPMNTFGETRSLRPELDTDSEAISIAPVIFQKRIKAVRELRVTIIGNDTFVHQVVVNNEKARQFPDWRLDVTAESVESTLDPNIHLKLRALMEMLGLQYGAIDLIESPEGDIYFLEVNPQGQFLFNEADAGSPMSASFASLLCGKHNL